MDSESLVGNLKGVKAVQVTAHSTQRSKPTCTRCWEAKKYKYVVTVPSSFQGCVCTFAFLTFTPLENRYLYFLLLTLSKQTLLFPSPWMTTWYKKAVDEMGKMGKKMRTEVTWKYEQDPFVTVIQQIFGEAFLFMDLKKLLLASRMTCGVASVLWFAWDEKPAASGVEKFSAYSEKGILGRWTFQQGAAVWPS